MVELSKVGEWAGEAIVAAGIGWVTANARIGRKLAALKRELLGVVAATEARAASADEALKREVIAELQDLAATLRADLKRLERDLENLEQRDVDARVQSAGDHSAAAALAKSLDEMRVQVLQTGSTLNRVLGLLQGKGIGNL